MRMKKENCKVSPNNYKLFLQTALIFQLIQIAKFLLDEIDKLNLVIQRDLLEEFMVLKLKYRNTHKNQLQARQFTSSF